MPTTGFPGGLTSPSIGGGWTAVPGKVFYVGNRSGLPSSNGKDPDHPFSTVNAALAKCSANRGDAVRILPGHVEAIDSADEWSSLVAGVLVEGYGTGNQRPVIRWSAAAATVLFDQAGTVLRNCRLQMAGDPTATTALTVAAPITVSAAGCAIQGCDIDCGVDADQIVTVGITTTAASDGFIFEDNFVHGAAAAEITAAGTFLRLVGCDRAVIRRNYFSAALATDTDGIIEFLTTASTDVDISDNYFYSNGGSSTCAVDAGADLVNTGRLLRNLMTVDADATAGTVVFTVHANCNFALLDNFLVNNNNERGLVIGTASV